ncbi:MAG: hypothetical protein WC655_23185 [Candidatus Hydrogenedentales bacterium]
MTAHPLTVIAAAGSLAAFESGHWKLGPGDPTVMGWVTAVGYALAALLCLWVAVRWRGVHTAGRSGKSALFWLTLGIIMFALAVNKQLDLQMWFWQTGKTFVKAHGLYRQRWVIQMASLGGILLAAVCVFFYFTRMSRGVFRENALALFGVLFTLCFVIIRASSMHHVDMVLGWHVGGVKLNWVFENGGILLVIIAALFAMRKVPPIHYTQFRKPDASGASE